MEITVRHKDTEITIQENEYFEKDSTSYIRCSDQNKQIQETIVVMVEQVKKLQDIEKTE